MNAKDYYHAHDPYHQRVEPLLEKIKAICKEAGIPWVAVFATEHDSEGVGFSAYHGARGPFNGEEPWEPVEFNQMVMVLRHLPCSPAELVGEAILQSGDYAAPQHPDFRKAAKNILKRMKEEREKHRKELD